MSCSCMMLHAGTVRLQLYSLQLKDEKMGEMSVVLIIGFIALLCTVGGRRRAAATLQRQKA